MATIVTGAAGFIGSNIVRGLNARGIDDIIAVDDLRDGHKFQNLASLKIADYFDKEEFLRLIENDGLDVPIDFISHQGACSDTTETDGRFMMDNNYRYSIAVLRFAQLHAAPLVYASSAAVYGDTEIFRESPQYEGPLNVYGYSKWLFDGYVRRHWDAFESQVVGLRYFNVYGPGEAHKGRMASVAHHFHGQISSGQAVRLFEAWGGYRAGEQKRDFISVEDVVKVNLFFMDHPAQSGIFNCGTGRAQSFNEVAVAALNTLLSPEAPETLDTWKSRGKLEYIAFPEDLKGRYQSYTEADLTALRNAGYRDAFLTVEEGVRAYLQNT